MNRAAHALAVDLPQLANSLASAFFDDPVTSWMFDDPEIRSGQLRRWMRFIVDMGLTRGHVYTAGENMAAAVWSPPDVTLFDEVWGPRMLEILRSLLGERAGEVIPPLARAMSLQPLDGPHFYLFTLGTHSDHQSRGLGGRVLEPVLALCDAQGLSAYLESSNPRNLPFYERHGFEVMGEIHLVEGGPIIRPMQRKPSAR